MLEQLRKPQTTQDERFRTDLMRMLAAIKVAQVYILAFQGNSTVKEGPEYKQLKRFSQEVFKKHDWFYSVVKKMAAENAEGLDTDLDIDGDKVNNIGEMIDHIMNTDNDVTDIVQIITSKHGKLALLQKVFDTAGFTSHPVIKIDIEQVYSEVFGK